MRIENTLLKKLETRFREFFPKRMRDYRSIRKQFIGKSGLEIGGPSMAFSQKGFIPLYDVIRSLDGCNFSSDTIWEGKIKEGPYFKFGNRNGWQYIKDAINLSGIEDNKYDFILSCHSIEHIANPIKAIEEWKRVIKENGFILIIVPHKDRTFDRKRAITKIEHIIEDYKNNMQEDDETHFEDAIANHDFTMDPGILSKQEFSNRTKINIENRCLHHHVFNTKLAIDLVDVCALKICKAAHFSPFHIIILAQKVSNKIENTKWLSADSPIYKNSPFPSDKNYSS